jgi:hypothetical protein
MALRVILSLIVFCSCLALPACEQALRDAPDIYTEPDVTIMLQKAYNTGRQDSHCTLPTGPRVSRKGGINL